MSLDESHGRPSTRSVQSWRSSHSISRTALLLSRTRVSLMNQSPEPGSCSPGAATLRFAVRVVSCLLLLALPKSSHTPSHTLSHTLACPRTRPRSTSHTPSHTLARPSQVHAVLAPISRTNLTNQFPISRTNLMNQSHEPISRTRFMQSWRNDIVGSEYRYLSSLQVKLDSVKS